MGKGAADTVKEERLSFVPVPVCVPGPSFLPSPYSLCHIYA